MKKYSKEWKEAKKVWVQPHTNEKWGTFYKVHYIENDTEYSKGEYLTRSEAEEEIKNAY